MTCADTPLRHGYTLADLEEMTRIAVAHDWSVAMDVPTKRDIARSAITLHLYEAEERPYRSALIQAGWKAIYREAGEYRRGRGYSRALSSITDHRDSAMAPGWLRYWWHGHGVPTDERVAERLAVWQILPTLSDTAREAVVALAATGGYPEAAEALGIGDSAFRRRLAHARRDWLAAWYGDETPHRPSTNDQRAPRYRAEVCGNGHVWAPENTAISRKVRKGRIYETRHCKACRREGAERARKRRTG